MPVQDAIDLARYLVETAIGFTKFSIMKQAKTVGARSELLPSRSMKDFAGSGVSNSIRRGWND
jgi:hypothetical protein